MPNDEELDEQSLFDSAVSDEPAETPVADVAEVKETPDQPRHEDGKFAKAEEPLEAQPEVKPDDKRIPEWRREEIAAEKNRAVDEANSLRERLAVMEADRANWKRPAEIAEQNRLAEQAKAAKPDPLLDPEGYEKYIENRIEEKLLNDRREFSLANAHKTYKGEFEEAYAAAQKQVDPALKARMQQSRDPGETLMEWHRERKTQAEIGGDINAYNQRKREELLKDPEFRKAAMQAWREDAQSSSNGRPRVDLPPSLNGASRSNSMLRPDGDLPDPDLWNEITA